MLKSRRFVFFIGRTWGDLWKVFDMKMLIFKNLGSPFPNDTIIQCIYESTLVIDYDCSIKKISHHFARLFFSFIYKGQIHLSEWWKWEFLPYITLNLSKYNRS